MNLRINGEQLQVESNIQTIDDLLTFLKLQDRIVVVEQNGEIVTKEQYQEQPVNDGDRIEIVQFVGGG
jgi:sulfur carrier protein